MDITHSIVSFFIPLVSVHQSSIIALSLLTLYTIGMYVYRCIRKPYSEKDLADTADNVCRMLKSEIDSLSTANLVYIEKIDELEAIIASSKTPNLSVPSPIDGKYQKERVIAALAVELDGFAAIEEKANVIVNALK